MSRSEGESGSGATGAIWVVICPPAPPPKPKGEGDGVTCCWNPKDDGDDDGGAPNAGVGDGVLNVGFEVGVQNAGVEEGAPKAGVDEGTPKAGVDDGAPNAGVEEGVPKAGVVEGVPKEGVEEGVPKREGELGVPNMAADAGDQRSPAARVTGFRVSREETADRPERKPGKRAARLDKKKGNATMGTSYFLIFFERYVRFFRSRTQGPRWIKSTPTLKPPAFVRTTKAI